jgi:hypothetical protein
MDTIRVQTLSKVARYASEGGFVIAHGLLPTHAAEGQEHDGEIKEYVREIFKNPKNTFAEDQTADFILRVRQHLRPNCEISPPSPEILCTRLSRDASTVFFLVNTSSKPWEGRCRFEVAGKITLSYPDSGKVVELHAPGADRSATKLIVSLESYQSVLISFQTSRR